MKNLVWKVKKRTHRWRHLRGADSIVSVRGRTADFDQVRETIRAAGTDSLEYFGNDYHLQGGLSLQQNSAEFAALICFLRERRPIRKYLEIGTASGGTCRMLYQHVGFEQVILMDDGRHPRAGEQKRNLAEIPNFSQFIGDSHNAAAAAFMKEHAGDGLDVAFVDGDHSERGVWLDIELVRPHLKRGGLLILHDTAACAGVEKAWMRVSADRGFRAVADFVGETHAMGIAIAEAV